MRVRQGVGVLAFTLAVAIAGAAAAQTSGEARIGGKVVDENKKPVQDVVVRATLPGQPRPLQAKTNNKGEWSINNLAGGTWELEFSKEGFATQKGNVELQGDQQITGIEVVLARPAADPRAAFEEEYKRAVGMMQNRQFAEARQILEGLLAKHPTVFQLHDTIARTYAAEGQIDKALEQSRLAHEKEPQNETFKVLLGALLLEKGQKDEAEKLLEGVDVSKVEDPSAFINLLIHRINDKRTDQAVELAEKLVARFPNDASLYYYRGRAYLQAKKMVEAKADLEKFVASASPDASELADARKLLEQMKDVK